MSFTSALISHSLVWVLKSPDMANRIRMIADGIDDKLDDFDSKRSERIQKQVVRYVLLPLSKELMKEDPGSFEELVKEES